MTVCSNMNSRPQNRRRFVIMDRDGTVIQERHYLSRPEDVELIPGAAEALKRLSSLGLGLIIVTNQSAVARGLFDLQRLAFIHRRLEKLLENEGVRLDGIYVCTHKPEDGCKCRKPELGLMEHAAGELGFEPGSSFMIGDKALDVEFGRRAGATTILVRTGYGAEVEQAKSAAPDYVTDNLLGAAGIICKILAV